MSIVPTEPVTGAPGLQWTAASKVSHQLIVINFYGSVNRSVHLSVEKGSGTILFGGGILMKP